MKMGPDPFSHAIRCARIPETMRVFLIDHHGYIRPFLIDDIRVSLISFGIDPNLFPLLTDLIHANLVYSFAEQVGLKPGLFELGDEAICENISKHISYNIDDDAHDAVLKILLDSWNNVATHPLAKTLSSFTNTEDDEKKTMISFDYYHVFFKNIFSGLLNLWKNPDASSIILYMNITEIYFSALERRPYSRNDFFNYDLLLREIKDCQANAVAESVETLSNCIQAIEARRDWAQKNCLIHIGGWCETELLDLEKEFDKEILGTALINILKRRDTLSSSDELNKRLQDIFKFNKYLYKIDKQHNSHIAGLTKFVFQQDREESLISNHEVERYIHEAIEYTIMKFAKEQGINIYDTAFEQTDALQFMTWDDEKIIEKLCDGTISQPHQLYILYHLKPSETIKTIILSLLDNSAHEEREISLNLMLRLGYLPSVIHVNAPRQAISHGQSQRPFTPGYNRLKSLISGDFIIKDKKSFEQALSSSVVLSLKDDEPEQLVRPPSL